MKVKNLINGDVTEQEFFKYHNLTVTYEVLPNSVKGFVFSYRNINNIFISKQLTTKEKRKTLIHELIHIELNHLNQYDKDLFAFNFTSYEDEADKYFKKLNFKE